MGAKMPQRQRRHIITVIFDATGVTAERVVRATLSQFDSRSVDIDLVVQVDSVPQIGEVASTVCSLAVDAKAAKGVS